LKSTTITKRTFEKAEALHKKEDFSGTAELLRNALHLDEEQCHLNGLSLSHVLILLGWNMISLRDFDGLASLEHRVTQLKISGLPEFDLIRVWALGIQGKTQDAILKANDFLSSQGNHIHSLHPDFLMARGRCYSQAGNSERPIQDCEAAYSIFLVQNRNFEAGRSANILGLHYGILGDYPKAIEWYSRAGRIFDTMDLQKKKSLLSLHLGLIHYKQGNFSQSLQLLKKSLHLGIKGNWAHRQCFANIALGGVYRMQRKFDIAQRHLQDGLTQAQSMSMAREEALAFEFLGDVNRDQGHLADAHNYYNKTLAIIQPLAPEGDVVSETFRRIGECHALNGEYLSAKPHLAKALEMTRRQGDRFEEAVTLRVLAESALSSGDATAALQHIIPSCDILEEIGADYELAISRFRYAEILVAGRHDNAASIPAIVLLNQAWHHASNAQNLFQKTGIQWWLGQAHGLVKRIAILQAQQDQRDLKLASSILNRDGKGYNPANIIVFKSMAMRRLLDTCDIYAPNDSSILIHGETGTGKELIARRLHEKSGRDGELVSVNVASISSTIFEREFFGHVKGSFSGADDSRIGFAEQAHKGTLFLDEIGELPLELQPKLLRLLQDGVFHAVGDSSERSVDIRLIAATNVDLFAAAKSGTFREDLYYRLQTLAVNVPSLKDRPEDILPLVEHFLSIAACRQVKISEFLNPVGIQLIEAYTWPGNVREIISICQQIHLQVSSLGHCNVNLGRLDKLAGILCGPGYLEMNAAEGQAVGSISDPRQQLVSALESSGGNRKEAARLMNVSRSTFYRKMKQFNI